MADLADDLRALVEELDGQERVERTAARDHYISRHLAMHEAASNKAVVLGQLATRLRALIAKHPPCDCAWNNTSGNPHRIDCPRGDQ